MPATVIRLGRLLAIVLVLGAVTLALAAPPDADSQARALLQPPPPPGPSRVEPPEGSITDFWQVPTLTEEEIARATDILNTDPRVPVLLKGSSFTVDKVGVGIDSTLNSPTDSEYVKVAVVMMISVPQPISAEGDWPVAFDVVGTRHISACAAPNGVREFSVVVDLNAGSLIRLQPGPHSPPQPGEQPLLLSEDFCEEQGGENSQRTGLLWLALPGGLGAAAAAVFVSRKLAAGKPSGPLR